jgi:hypothetical protein
MWLHVYGKYIVVFRIYNVILILMTTLYIDVAFAKEKYHFKSGI